MMTYQFHYLESETLSNTKWEGQEHQWVNIDFRPSRICQEQISVCCLWNYLWILEHDLIRTWWCGFTKIAKPDLKRFVSRISNVTWGWPESTWSRTQNLSKSTMTHKAVSHWPYEAYACSFRGQTLVHE